MYQRLWVQYFNPFMCPSIFKKAGSFSCRFPLGGGFGYDPKFPSMANFWVNRAQGFGMNVPFFAPGLKTKITVRCLVMFRGRIHLRKMWVKGLSLCRSQRNVWHFVKDLPWVLLPSHPCGEVQPREGKSKEIHARI